MAVILRDDNGEAPRSLAEGGALASGARLVESVPGGRLERRGALGGCGKASMLTVLRNVLPGVGMADDGDAPLAARVGIESVDFVFALFGEGMADSVTERVPTLGDAVAERRVAGEGRPEDSRCDSLLRGISIRGRSRVLPTGSGGNGMFGGACPRGIELVMVAVPVDDMATGLWAGGKLFTGGSRRLCSLQTSKSRRFAPFRVVLLLTPSHKGMRSTRMGEY